MSRSCWSARTRPTRCCSTATSASASFLSSRPTSRRPCRAPGEYPSTVPGRAGSSGTPSCPLRSVGPGRSGGACLALSEDQTRLSLKLPLARELMIEAASLARTRARSRSGTSIWPRPCAPGNFRVNLFEEEYLEEYDREMIKVSTTGEAVGRANGLSVRMFGDYAFGLPHQIACTVGVGARRRPGPRARGGTRRPHPHQGHDDPKSYLLERFAKDKPIVMAGSLCFEQSYAAVEGDSASAPSWPPCSALVRAAHQALLRHDRAVSQSGAILAVGGLNEKIGAFSPCARRRGLTGGQGGDPARRQRGSTSCSTRTWWRPYARGCSAFSR